MFNYVFHVGLGWSASPGSSSLEFHGFTSARDASAADRNLSPNGPVVAMPGQDVNIAPLKFLPEHLHTGFVHGGLDGRGKFTLQLFEFPDLPAKGITGDPLFADPCPCS